MRTAAAFVLLIVAALVCLQVSVAKKASKSKPFRAQVLGNVNGCRTKADIFFAIDSSESLGQKNFNKIRSFTAALIRALNTGRIRVGVVLFSDKAYLRIKLKDFRENLDKAAQKVLKIAYKRGKTATGEALTLIRQLGFKQRYGHRKGTKKIVVIITDGNPNGADDAVKMARRLLHRNTRIVCLGVGENLKTEILRKMAGSMKNVRIVKHFKNLKSIQRTMRQIICRGKGSKSVHVKRNKKGKIVAVIKKKICRKHCSSGYRLTRKCTCRLRKRTCRNRHGKIKKCGKGYGRNKHCRCVKKHVKAIKRCRKRCPRRFSLNRATCRCQCRRRCHGNKTLIRSRCQCRCRIKCHLGFNLDRRSCACRRKRCSLGMKLRKGKCVVNIHYACKKKHLQIRKVCRKIAKCPPGYRRTKLRKCKRVCCRGPCSRDKKSCLPVACGKDKWVINGRCRKVIRTKCPRRAFFNLLKPLCPKTCTEPVSLTFCRRKWTGPGCSCYPGFLLHKGKCVHPDDCPNKPLCLKDSDIMIMMDSSVSVGRKNFYLMKRFTSNLVQQLNINKGKCHRLSVIQYNHRFKTILSFRDYRKFSHAGMIRTVEAMKYKPGLTYLGEALFKAGVREFSAARGMRRDVPRVLFLLTDGTGTNGRLDPFYEAAVLRRKGVQIVVMKLGGQSRKHKNRLYKLVGVGGKVFVFGLRHFNQISQIIARVVSFNCQNFACPLSRNILHKCRGEYQRVDKVEYFKKQYRCVRRVIRNHSKKRCSCPRSKASKSPCKAYFQTVKTTKYKFDKHKSVCHEKVRRERIRCACPKSRIRVGKCRDNFHLVHTTHQYLTKSYSRGKFCRVVHLKKSLRCACPKKKIRSKKCIGGFRVLVITRWRFVKKTRKCIKKVSEKEVRCSCPKPVIYVKPCLNKRINVKVHLLRLSKRKKCVVDTYVAQEKCKRVCPSKADVGIIIDTSSSMKKRDFALVKTFVRKLVGTFPVAEKKTRVALMSYSSAHRIYVIANFLTFLHMKPLQTRIDELGFYRGTTQTGEALEIYRNDVLQSTHGSRIGENVKQVVYLITDGVANGHANPVNEAKKLRALGVRVVIVAIGKHASKGAIHKMASSPSEFNVFSISTFRDLKKHINAVSLRRCTMQGGVSHVSVKYKYRRALAELQAQNKGSQIAKLSGKAFLKFKKLDASDFTRIVVHIRGYYTVIAGAKSLKRKNYVDNLRRIVALLSGVHKYEIRRIRLRGHLKKKVTKLSFSAPDVAIKRFAKIISAKQFKVKGKNGKYLKVKKVIVIGTSIRHVARYTRRIDGITERIVASTYALGSKSKTLQKIRRLRRNIALRVRRLHKLLFRNEWRAAGLAKNINQNNLKVIKLCRVYTVKALGKKKQRLRLALKRMKRYMKKIRKYITRIAIGIDLVRLHKKQFKKIAKKGKAAKAGAAKKSSGGGAGSSKAPASSKAPVSKAAAPKSSAPPVKAAASTAKAAAASTKAAAASSTAAAAGSTAAKAG